MFLFSTVISWLVKLCPKIKVKVFPISILQTSITLCYFVGDDILKSHLMYNKRWAFVPKQSTSGLTRYINDLTLAANKLLGIRPYSILPPLKFSISFLYSLTVDYTFDFLNRSRKLSTGMAGWRKHKSGTPSIFQAQSFTEPFRPVDNFWCQNVSIKTKCVTKTRMPTKNSKIL